ncbi:MAG: hypothetical protein K2K37_10270, partial [Muribaculaceae bacterium]|nr:hypothetical protein [Muribaculaceae bacterium]
QVRVPGRRNKVMELDTLKSIPASTYIKETYTEKKSYAELSFSYLPGNHDRGVCLYQATCQSESKWITKQCPVIKQEKCGDTEKYRTPSLKTIQALQPNVRPFIT